MNLNDQQLADLVIGSTLYHQLAPGSPQGEGEAVFYFGAEDRAAARLPSGKLMRGSYSIEDSAYRLNWDGGLQNSRSTLSPEPGGGYACRNAENGTLRSTVVRIDKGDPESISE